MMFNATFNNISVISWLSVLLMEETGVHMYLEETGVHMYLEKNHPLSQVNDKLYHIMFY